MLRTQLKGLSLNDVHCHLILSPDKRPHFHLNLSIYPQERNPIRRVVRSRLNLFQRSLSSIAHRPPIDMLNSIITLQLMARDTSILLHRSRSRIGTTSSRGGTTELRAFTRRNMRPILFTSLVQLLLGSMRPTAGHCIAIHAQIIALSHRLFSTVGLWKVMSDLPHPRRIGRETRADSLETKTERTAAAMSWFSINLHPPCDMMFCETRRIDIRFLRLLRLLLPRPRRHTQVDLHTVLTILLPVCKMVSRIMSMGRASPPRHRDIIPTTRHMRLIIARCNLQ
jgi:hypothetical protein